jgi:hypothetical protein
MYKFIKKKVLLGGSGKGKPNVEGKAATSDSAPPKFDLNDTTVTRLSEMLEVAVRTKLTNQSGDPLSIVDDEATASLANDFLFQRASKQDYEIHSASTLWSTALSLVNSGNRLLSEQQCHLVKSAGVEDTAKLASELSLPVQRLLGILFASAELLIRDEPRCAPLVLNALANSLMWALPPSSFVATNAVTNLLVDHRRLFPSCHTFARRISTTASPITAQEWRGYCTASVAIYGQPSDGSGEPTTVVVVRDIAAATSSSPAEYGRGKAPLPASARAVRSSFTSDLPLNDISASASIDSKLVLCLFDNLHALILVFVLT